MGYVEGKCPKCGKEIKESCNAWVYGSPIRVCPYCKEEFLDKRWREVAIDGFDPRSGNAAFYLKGLLLFLVFTVVCALMLINMVHMQGHYPMKLAACVVGGIIGFLGCAFMYLRIRLGYEARKNDIYMEESEQRLKNRDYVEKLTAYGYNIPEKYRK